MILYQSLTGRLPFTGKYFEVIMDKQNHDPRPPIELVPGVPQDLNQLCMDLLRRRPKTGRAAGMCSAFWATARLVS